MATASVLPLPEPLVSPEAPGESHIIVRPMLTTAQKNFKAVSNCKSITKAKIPPKISREELPVKGSRCFLLRNLLTDNECTHYIKECERIGFSDLSGLFPAGYRSNDRVLSICQELVDALWARIEPFLTRREAIRIRPIGFGNEGTWKPFRLNECCKFGRYRAGGHFSPHIDGPWVPREDESSVFTVIIYLNSNFKGGTTNFLDETNGGNVVCSVKPRSGTALIFNHDSLHEGQPVTEGSKYIIRTEIMYRRVDTEMLPHPTAYQKDESYIKTLALYRKSWKLEKVGDVKGFTDTYLEAIRLQKAAQASVGDYANSIFEQAIPYEIYMRIFEFLTPSDVCNVMRVCKMWYDMGMDGQLWYSLYKRHWPIGIKLEAQLDHTKKTLKQTPGTFLKDWYGVYKQRVKMSDPKKVVVLDLGSYSFKCAAIHRGLCTLKTAMTESVVAVVDGIFDLHIRRMNYERNFCGRYAKDAYPSNIVNIVERGVPVKPHFLPEIVTGFYLDCRVRPNYTPVVILEPPGLWNDKNKADVAYTFLKQYQQPSVSFVSSALAVLCGVDRTCGIVLDVGHGVVTCAAVWQWEEIPTAESCDPQGVSPAQLAEMVHDVATSSCDKKEREKFKMLISNVVVTGGNAPGAKLIEKELLKKDGGYQVIEPDDRLLAAVEGGCTLSSLSIFNEFQSEKTITSESLSSVSDEIKKSFYKWAVTQDWWMFPMFSKREHYMYLRIPRSYADSFPWFRETNWYEDSDDGESFVEGENYGSSEEEEELESGNGEDEVELESGNGEGEVEPELVKS